ncbi:DNA repair and recombination protein RadB [Methanothermobacter thermautotrophicus]|uniref:DNA repair and recombination protein RadB n=1 Tax=Methanothermobacter thermautotrophicus TaxID=145262 RepID=UPI0022B95C26|nr:DNA repair and recombination protein RadB [Methanothermobacter thermautotrophicus]WBF07962.1 DNA repair and recombination protein RadB [Methanothermobacter thermautotrophicus]
MKKLRDMGENRRIPTESSIDRIMGGGVERRTITQFYGPPGSGKTNIAIKLAVETARRGKNTVFIDTEGGLSVERIRQVSGDIFDRVADSIIVFEPSSFTEQGEALQRTFSFLKTHGDSTDLVVLDSAVALYRLKEGNASSFNLDLGRQMFLLLQMARRFDLAAVITNQIYSITGDGGREYVSPVGGTLLRYWSKVMVELEMGERPGERFAVLRRHRNRLEGSRVGFRIVADGIL